MTHSRIFKIAFLSLLSTALVKAINFLSIPIMSRMLSTSEYGNVDIFFSYANIFIFILGLDTQGAIPKAKLDFKDSIDAYMSTNLIFTIVFSFIIILIVNISYTSLQSVIGLSRLETNLMFIYGYALYLISFRTAENNFDYKYKKNIVMTGVASLLSLFFSIVLILTIFDKDRQGGRIIGATTPMFICGVLIFLSICRRGKWIFNKDYICYALKFSVPLIPHNLSHIILSNADRIMIKNMISPSDAGIYSLSYNLGMVMTVVFEGMNQVFTPWLFRKIDKGEIVEIKKAQHIYLLSFVVVEIIVMTFSPEFVKLIGPHEYWDGTRIVIWIVYAVFLNFSYTLYVNIEFFYLKSKWISTGTIAAAAINCGLNLIFLKKYGYIFGAISTVVSYAALLVFHMIIVNHILKKRYMDNCFVIIVGLIVFGITIVLNLLLDYTLPRFIFGIMMALIVSIILLLINRKQRIIEFIETNN